MRYQGIDDYSVMLTIASVIFSFLFCLSVARTFSETVSPFIGCRQRNYFFLNFLCGSFSRHQHLTPSVTLFFFCPVHWKAPLPLSTPLHLCLHYLAFLPVHTALNPRQRMSTLQQDLHLNSTEYSSQH